MGDFRAVDGFLLEHIDSVPHLEALLLLWNSRPRRWSAEDMAKALFLTTEATRVILADLVRRGIIAAGNPESDSFWYQTGGDRDEIISAVDQAYRTELIRVTRIIHSKPSPAVRAFAQAFRLKKDRN
jgi:predicted ArsR family transcriptional regulator